MLNFNKLYNILLQSIIFEGRAERQRILSVLEDQKKRIQIGNFLTDLAKKGKVESKAADFIVKFFASKQLTDINDKRIQNVVDILQHIPNYDIQTKKISLNDFLTQNEKYLIRNLKDQKIDIIKYIDTHYKDLFTQKKRYKRGVIIYRVDESRAGQAAVRKIIDINLGDNWNPWCLASRKGRGLEQNYKTFWIGDYVAFPKHIAFQNGQLIAFCADNHGNCTWWNRTDKPSDKLQLLDGSYMQTDKYEWTLEEKREKLILKNELIYNKETGRWDCTGSVLVNNVDIVDHKFPILFGQIKGDFSSASCSDLLTLQNGPTKVGGNYSLYNCINLSSLKGLAQQIGGKINLDYCKELTSLEYIPRGKKSKVSFKYCYKLPEWIKKSTRAQLSRFIRKFNLVCGKDGLYYPMGPDLIIDGITLDLDYLPVKFGNIKGNCILMHLTELKSLEGLPEEVGGSFELRSCHQILTLKGGPKKVGRDYEIITCYGLKTLQSAPEEVGRNFVCDLCTNLQSIEGLNQGIRNKAIFVKCQKLPVDIKIEYIIKNNNLIYNKQTGLYDCDGDVKLNEQDIIDGKFAVKFGEVKGNFKCYWCNELTSLQNAPRKVGGNFTCSSSRKLNSLVGCPQEVGGDVDIEFCGTIASLKGLPKIINNNLLILSTDVKSLGDGPQQVKGNLQLSSSSFTNLVGMPKVNGYLKVRYCDDLVSLHGAEGKVKNIYYHHSEKLIITAEDKKNFIIKGK